MGQPHDQGCDELSVELLPFSFSGTASSGTECLAAVATRHGGVSTGVYCSLNLGGHVGDDPDAVRENRDRLAAACGVDRVRFMDQQHTATVAVVDALLAGRGHGGDAAEAFPATDALVTDLPGVALAVLVADCVPVVLVDPVRRAVGVAHCGRAGTLLGLLPATVGAMTQAFGTDPGDLRVGLGPCIGAASYEVGPHEVAQVAAALPGLDLLVPTRDGHALLDLLTALRHQLDGAGVPAAQVEVSGVDTLSSTDRFFSDRAARPCGRFAAVVRLGPPLRT